MNWKFWQRKPAAAELAQEQPVISQPDPPQAAKKGRGPGRPFKPGQSGNPGGRPKGTSVTAVLRELLDQAGPDSVAAPLLELAQGGDIQAIKVLLDRTEGKVKEQLEHSGAVAIRVQYADDYAADTARCAEAGPAGKQTVQYGELRPALGEDRPGPDPGGPAGV